MGIRGVGFPKLGTHKEAAAHDLTPGGNIALQNFRSAGNDTWQIEKDTLKPGRSRQDMTQKCSLDRRFAVRCCAVRIRRNVPDPGNV